MQQDPHEMAMEPLVPAFRNAMHNLDTHLRKEGMETDLFSLYSRVSDLAKALVSQFENAIYEQRSLRLELEKQQAAYQKLAVQAEYREKRELILEQAYVETQIAIRTMQGQLKDAQGDKREAQQQLNRIRREHTLLVEEVGELKAANAQIKAENDQFASAVVGGENRSKTLEAAWDDAMKAVDATRQDRDRLRRIARNRRHALIDAGNFLMYLKAESRLMADGVRWKDRDFHAFVDHLADMARPVDYSTGEPQHIPDDTPEADVKEAVEGLRHADELHAEAQGVAEQLGYSKRAHDFPPGENMKDVACLRCGIGWLECVDDNHYCNAEEADESGVHLGAQIATVAEAIENGQH